MWASLLSRNVLPGVVNIRRSTYKLLDRILDGAQVPDLEHLSIPVLVSAFDVTRCADTDNSYCQLFHRTSCIPTHEFPL